MLWIILEGKKGSFISKTHQLTCMRLPFAYFFALPFYYTSFILLHCHDMVCEVQKGKRDPILFSIFSLYHPLKKKETCIFY